MTGCRFRHCSPDSLVVSTLMPARHLLVVSKPPITFYFTATK
jgi:hypothetical protein